MADSPSPRSQPVQTNGLAAVPDAKLVDFATVATPVTPKSASEPNGKADDEPLPRAQSPGKQATHPDPNAGAGVAANTTTSGGNIPPPLLSPSVPFDEQLSALTSVLSLATLFFRAVSCLTGVVSSKPADHDQRQSITRIGIEQARLLILGDVLGICSPPSSVARSAVPKRAGDLNPDPTMPIYFEPRDPRLNEASSDFRARVEGVLRAVSGELQRPKEKLLEAYGLRVPKQFSSLVMTLDALDQNRMEAFRERYALVRDLSDTLLGAQSPTREMRREDTGRVPPVRWAAHDARKVGLFAVFVRGKVDELEALAGGEASTRIDRAFRNDVRAMAWHPEMSAASIRRDWEKLRHVKEAVAECYPRYSEATETALAFITTQLKGNYKPHWTLDVKEKKKKDKDGERVSQDGEETVGEEAPKRRQSIWRKFAPKRRDSVMEERQRKKSTGGFEEDVDQEALRSLSEDMSHNGRISYDVPERSKSVS